MSTSSPGERGAPPSLLSIRNLSIHFQTRHRDFKALHGVDLDVRAGEALGLVGESGSGKSITWLAVLGLLGKRVQVAGEAIMGGDNLLVMDEERLSGVRGRKIAMIFQDASSALNPVRRIGAQLVESLHLHWGMEGASAQAEAKRLLDRVQIPNAAQRLRDYPHQLSGGMNQRVMIAIALAGRPELLIADEPTTALDVTVQAQILRLLDELRRDENMAMVLISHDFGVVAECCDRVAVMYAGRVVEQAANPAIFEKTAHPYTAGLLSAMPDATATDLASRPIPGSVPEPWNMPPGCVFEPRCGFAVPDCRKAQPPLEAIRTQGRDRHLAACIRTGEIGFPSFVSRREIEPT